MKKKPNLRNGNLPSFLILRHTKSFAYSLFSLLHLFYLYLHMEALTLKWTPMAPTYHKNKANLCILAAWLRQTILLSTNQPPKNINI